VLSKLQALVVAIALGQVHLCRRGQVLGPLWAVLLQAWHDDEETVPETEVESELSPSLAEVMIFQMPTVK
jgi:hypothetical protein